MQDLDPGDRLPRDESTKGWAQPKSVDIPVLDVNQQQIAIVQINIENVVQGTGWIDLCLPSGQVAHRFARPTNGRLNYVSGDCGPSGAPFDISISDPMYVRRAERPLMNRGDAAAATPRLRRG